jgi:hypothetical protein
MYDKSDFSSGGGRFVRRLEVDGVEAATNGVVDYGHVRG